MKYCLIFFILFSCDFIDQNHFEVDDRLAPYVKTFYQEAEKRGVYIQSKKLIVRFETLNGLAGQSITNSLIPTINIDIKTFNDWEKRDVKKCIEYIVFHELGHALLYRSHTESYSIMTSDNLFMGDFRLDEIKRKVLIDELFYQKIK